ncbi:hypothetical protein Hanom_Chr12g01136161 [Helianthus anomalus]
MLELKYDIIVYITFHLNYKMAYVIKHKTHNKMQVYTSNIYNLKKIKITGTISSILPKHKRTVHWKLFLLLFLQNHHYRI